MLNILNIYTIIIMSRRQHRSPWPSPAICFYRSSLPVGFQGYILYRQRAVVHTFKLFSWLCSSMWWGPQEYVAYEFVLTFPAVYIYIYIYIGCANMRVCLRYTYCFRETSKSAPAMALRESPWRSGLRSGLWHCITRVQSPVVLLRSLSD